MQEDYYHYLWKGWYFLGVGGCRPWAMVAMALDWLRRWVGDVISGEDGGGVVIIMVAVRKGVVGVVGALRGVGGTRKEGDSW